jgi:hypothetical protein
MKHIFYAYVITVLVFSACSSGKSTFERGNYYEAVITSVNRLRRNSDHKKSVETLRQAYPFAVTFYEDRAKTSLASTGLFKWSAVVDAYAAINTMHDEIKRCPGALVVIPSPVNYYAQLQEARKNAAEEHYTAGITAMQAGNREKAKQAYTYFKNADQVVTGYKDVARKMEEARWAATVKILLEPIPVHSKTVGVSAEFFNDKISEYVHAASINEFVRFYTRAEAKKLKVSPDQIIQLQFDEFTVGEVYRYEKEIQLTKDSVLMGTYVSASSANGAGKGASPVSTGTGLVATTDQGVSTANGSTDQSEAAKAAAEKERLEKERAAKEQAEKEKAEREKAEKEAADRALADKMKADKEKADREKAEAEKAEKEKAERERIEKENAEKARAEKEKAEREKAEKERAEKEAAEWALADKRKAEKQKADREKAAKALAEKGTHADPTIHPDDTTNVKDPVTICHTPPGNNMKHRTLVINRAALKAHLAHGDKEGTCEPGNEDNQDKQNNKKENTPGRKGSGKIDKNGNEHVLRLTHDQVLFASIDPAVNPLVGYTYPPLADTNKVYGTVKATLHHYRKTTTSKGVVSFKIIDAKTGALLSVEKMPGEFVWVSEWATFNGDERALSPEQLALTKLKELPAPPPQDLFIEFTKPIYDQITTKINEFYKAY